MLAPVALTLLALGGAEAFAGPSTRANAQPVARHAATTMQFFKQGQARPEALPKGWRKVPSQSRPGEFSYENIKTKKRYNKIPSGQFYDDELDTVSKPAWNPFAEEERADKGFRSPQEAAGFDENGNDLANSGGALYLATVPFILFALSYLFGAIGSPYAGSGNF